MYVCVHVCVLKHLLLFQIRHWKCVKGFLFFGRNYQLLCNHCDLSLLIVHVHGTCTLYMYAVHAHCTSTRLLHVHCTCTCSAQCNWTAQFSEVYMYVCTCVCTFTVHVCVQLTVCVCVYVSLSLHLVHSLSVFHVVLWKSQLEMCWVTCKNFWTVRNYQTFEQTRISSDILYALCNVYIYSTVK